VLHIKITHYDDGLVSSLPNVASVAFHPQVSQISYCYQEHLKDTSKISFEEEKSFDKKYKSFAIGKTTKK
jgi:hypothetical protein